MRFFIIFIMITVCMFMLVFYIQKKLLELDIRENITGEGRGLYIDHDDYLKQFPPEQWQMQLMKIRPAGGSIINILPIDKLPLNPHQINQIKDNQFVYLFGQTNDYFPEVIYKKVGNSSYAYQEFMDFTDSEKLHRFMGWQIIFLINNLKNTNPDKWPVLLKKYSEKHRFPVTIQDINHLTISKKLKQELLKNKWAIDLPDKFDKNIEFIYVPLSQHQILQLGPIQHPFTNIYSTYILFAVVLITIELLIFISALLFANSLEKLKRMSNSYSKGQFDHPPKMHKSSTLYPLFNDLKKMGTRIQYLIQLQKDLTHSVAHELRTPLSRMHFILDSLKKTQDKNEILTKLYSMEEFIEELEDLVAEILQYAKLTTLEAGDFKKILIVPILENMTNQMNAIIHNKKIFLHVSADLKNVAIMANENYFKRVLQNLLQNGVRFAESTINVSLLEINPTHYQLIIEDDGPGINEKDRDRVFEPFVQLNNQSIYERSGYGFGLAIVKKIVAQHHWSISIDDAEMGGAKFIINILFINPEE